MQLSITKTTTPKPKPDQSKLEFGKYFTDHMFIMNYTVQHGWHSARIVPYAPLSLDPAAMVFHYGQAIFEGLKAFCLPDGGISLFRPDQNMLRVNSSNLRLSMPQIDVDFVQSAILKLVDVDRDWVPTLAGTSLYIRPFMMATEPALGVRPANEYVFAVILSPVGSYYKEGLNPVKIYVENKYVRAVRGGTGAAKTAGNYAASLNAQTEAHEQGYSQVLWLDGIEHKYIDEVGAMNIFFVLDGEVVTPALDGGILPGITRASCIELLRGWGYRVSERRLPIDEVWAAHQNGTLKEAFGTGTAAVICPIGELLWNGSNMQLSGGGIGELSQKLYNELTGIQRGSLPDKFGWNVRV